MAFQLEQIIRKNIKDLKPYSSARDEFKGKEGIFFDANENPYHSLLSENFNRYPDPQQLDLKKKISLIKELPIENIFLGNGSDEAIDILFRAFCNPGIDNVVICPPTYGMYEVSANINDVKIIEAALTAEDFQLNTERVLQAITPETKLIFICCPNNPTGNGVKWASIKIILESFRGIVVVDEAYINFASYDSLIPELLNYPNLVILQTLSKAWGLAGLRIGMAFASEKIIHLFNKIKPPYNINTASQYQAIKALDKVEEINLMIQNIISEREMLRHELKRLPFVITVFPSEANFLLVKVNAPDDIYKYLTSNNIIVRNRSKIKLCEGCLRITVGTPGENQLLLNALKNFNQL
ncbi:MAG: histidinol-phosphate transaminase [Bacteroidetes bacterium]|nr:histidinol-phosphate transaminase [Bacteroidota bacterium]